jgi:hypothetical protein
MQKNHTENKQSDAPVNKLSQERATPIECHKHSLHLPDQRRALDAAPGLKETDDTMTVHVK